MTRLSDGEWQTAWARCYNPKPARAVEFEARLAPIIQEKFHLDTAYCDVHTAVTPWTYCDFDARVPGAGTFAATFYAYGEIMLHQKKTWNGPVYSEGNNHWYYCGLTDGNYGQDQAARLAENPWLVDFDLRKLHPLVLQLRHGQPGHVLRPSTQGLGKTPEEREARLDRFLAATLAFGHTGLPGPRRRHAQRRAELLQRPAGPRRATPRQTAAEIRYADAEGNLLDTSAAVASGAYPPLADRHHVRQRPEGDRQRPSDGDVEDVAEAVLPPNGWYRQRHAREASSIAWSAMVDGHRADYVDSPAYLYADGRGRFTRFAKAACDGQMIAHKRADGVVRGDPRRQCTSFGVSLDGRTGTAVALDEDGGTLGPAETRLSRGLVYVTPVAKAFSYLRQARAGRRRWRSSATGKSSCRAKRSRSRARRRSTFHVPADAKPGKRLWQQFDGAWIDFTVRPMVDASASAGQDAAAGAGLAPGQGDRRRRHPGRRNPRGETAAREGRRTGVSVAAARG